MKKHQTHSFCQMKRQTAQQLLSLLLGLLCWNLVSAAQSRERLVSLSKEQWQYCIVAPTEQGATRYLFLNVPSQADALTKAHNHVANAQTRTKRHAAPKKLQAEQFITQPDGWLEVFEDHYTTQLDTGRCFADFLKGLQQVLPQRDCSKAYFFARVNRDGDIIGFSFTDVASEYSEQELAAIQQFVLAFSFPKVKYGYHDLYPLYPLRVNFPGNYRFDAARYAQMKKDDGTLPKGRKPTDAPMELCGNAELR